MKIISKGEGRNFEAALQFVITNKEKNYLYGASFAGFPSASWAIDATLCNNRRVIVELGTGTHELFPASSLRHLEKKVDRLVHIMILPKSSLLIEEKESHMPPVVLSWNGDLKKSVGEYLAHRYSLPWEWVDKYYNLFSVEELIVIADSSMGECNLKAAIVKKGVSATSLSPEDVDEVINNALTSGLLKIPKSEIVGTYAEGDTLQDYLKTNAQVFAKQVDQIKPLYSPSEVKQINPAIAMDRIPFPVQAHAIQAITTLFKKQNSAFLNGDMGTGKSIIATGVASVLNSKKKNMSVLLTSPGIVLPKWCKDEIGCTLPESKILKIGSAEDAKRYQRRGGRYEVVTAAEYLKRVREGYKPEGLEFVVLSIDRAKLGPSTWCGAVLWKRMKGTKTDLGWHCPDCGELITKKVEEVEVPCDWEDFVSTEYSDGLFGDNGYTKEPVNWKQKPTVKKCPSCKTNLMRPALKSRGETKNNPRWYAALILKKLKKYFSLYIADEVHESRAEDSGRGFAFTQAVRSSKKTLCLTGTLVNGMSTSIKELLWRTNAGALIQDGFDSKTGTVTWAGRYGVLQKTIREETGDAGVTTKRRRYQESQPREKAGISPELVANHLLDKTVFIELPDLGLPLVKLKEIPVCVALDEEHQKEYAHFHEKLYEKCMEAYREGNGKAFSQFIPNTINAVDRSDIDLDVEIDEATKVEFKGFGPDYYNAKERELVRIIRENIAEDRGCIVHCFYTDKYAVHRRLEKVLEDHCIENVAVMSTTVKQEDRIAWLEEQNNKGIKVIITNMRLISMGIDIIPWPTSIFYQLNYNVDTLRQVSRRAWRPYQFRECRNYYMVALDTQQMSQFKTCLEKRAHAMITEGRLEKSELPNYIAGSRMHLASDLAHCIADESIGLKWSDLAGRDIEDVETYDEAEFKEALQKAQRKLANETLRLCGIEEEEIETVISRTDTKKPSFIDLLSLMPKRTRRKSKIILPDGYEQLSLFGEAV